MCRETTSGEAISTATRETGGKIVKNGIGNPRAMPELPQVDKAAGCDYSEVLPNRPNHSPLERQARVDPLGDRRTRVKGAAGVLQEMGSRLPRLPKQLHRDAQQRSFR